MERRDWLLLAIGYGMLEPVQVQKLMFMFAQKEDTLPADEGYDFVPYDWGPCSFNIYKDIDDLIENGGVERVKSSGGWSRYVLTDEGRECLTQLIASADEHLLNRLSHWREWVKERAFRKLLIDVYQEYPEYAVASRLEG